MNAKNVRAAVAEISADTDPTRKAAKLASPCSALLGSQEACEQVRIRYLAGVYGTYHMKKASLPLIIGLVALTGCASHYVMRLNNNSEITTATKPKLKDGVYYFKDAKGEEQSVPEFRVREMAPARMAAREDKPQPVRMEQHKKHKWYLLWLA